MNTDNAKFYCDNKLPFVMGTTGGDREQVIRDVEESGVYAVVAPNMGKQIVAFQTMIEIMAEKFPGCFSGYSLRVVESHQRTKVDTSGTAKAVVASFQKMGLNFEEARNGDACICLISPLHLITLVSHDVTFFVADFLLSLSDYCRVR